MAASRASRDPTGSRRPGRQHAAVRNAREVRRRHSSLRHRSAEGQLLKVDPRGEHVGADPGVAERMQRPGAGLRGSIFADLPPPSEALSFNNANRPPKLPMRQTGKTPSRCCRRFLFDLAGVAQASTHYGRLAGSCGHSRGWCRGSSWEGSVILYRIGTGQCRSFRKPTNKSRPLTFP